MKVRFLTVFVLILSMVLPTLGMPAGAAQPQPTGPTTHAQSLAERPATTVLGTHPDPPERFTAQPRREADEPPAPPDLAQAREALQSAPLMFIENVGQFDERARFQVRGGDGALWLAENALWITVVEPGSEGAEERGTEQQHVRASAPQPRKGVNLKLSFVGADPSPRLEPFNLVETSVNYFLGDDPEEWRSNVPTWGGVRYVDLYPGVDLEITGEGGHWVWRLVNHQPATSDPYSDIRLRVEGADNLVLDGDHLRLTTAIGELSLPLLTVAGAVPSSQPTTPAGRLAEIANPKPGTFEVSALFSALRPRGSSAPHSFVPQDNPASLLYSTFVGGSGSDGGGALALDGAGNVLVAGRTESSDFPTTAGAYDTGHNGDGDVSVFKLAADGRSLLYSTFVGGSDAEWGYTLALDGAGNALVTGGTWSSDFPTTAGAYDTSHNGSSDAFVFKLATDGGSLLYSTFVGGSEEDYSWGLALALDGAGNAMVTGTTLSSDFPTTLGAYDTTFNGTTDAFVFKLAADGRSLLHSTFVGGSSDECCTHLALNGAGEIVVVGRTGSLDFPTTAGAYDTSYNGGYFDAFVFKLAAGGDSLLYSTFAGGSAYDWGHAFALDGAGEVVVTGNTRSSDFPTTLGAYDTTFNGATDVFVFKLAADGRSLLYSTFVGGSDADYGYGLALNGAGEAVVSGQTYSPDFPTTPGAYSTTHKGYLDVSVFKLAADGGSLLYSTFVGGSGYDSGMALALDGAGNVLVAGRTWSSDFPTTAGAYDTTFNGTTDVFVLKLALGGGPGPNYSISGRVTDASGDSLSGVTVSAGAGVDATTDANGDYAITNLIAGTYTLTASRSGYTFSPSSRTISVPPDATGQGFTGTPQQLTYSISGHVQDVSDNPIRDVTVSAAGGGSATTDSSGAYNITDLVAGIHTVTPSKAGYTFSPPAPPVSVPPSQSGQDFMAIPLTVDRIEINQALGQQHNNARRFVAGKHTVMRAFLSAPVVVDQTVQQAIVRRDGNMVTTLYPQPSQPADVLTFLCPNQDACGNWEQGEYTFDVTVNGVTSQNSASFQSRTSLSILAVPVLVKDRGVVTQLPDDQWMTAWQFLRQVYPIPSDGVDWQLGSELDATWLDLTSNIGRNALWGLLKLRQPFLCGMRLPPFAVPTTGRNKVDNSLP